MLRRWTVSFKSMEKHWKAPPLDERHSKHSNITLQVDAWVELIPWIETLRSVTSPHVPEVISGHERSPAVFSAITFGGDKLEQWKHLRFVQADDTDRLAMQHDLFRSGHHLDLWSDFQNYLLRSAYNSFDALWQEEFEILLPNVFHKKQLFL